ncbi:unnamed protein product [Caenorhabditis sp. 36 PRJEB53466]|nr:unnamed protein product [Caenorhabditis sp. 36 PRJEB53466]
MATFVMDSVCLMLRELKNSAQLRWTLFSVVANLSLTLSIWIGVYHMQVNLEHSKWYFLDSSYGSTTGNAILDGLINGVGTILVLGSVSFVMLAFVLYDFQRIVKGWLIFSCVLILFGVSGQTLFDLFSQIFDQDTENGFFFTVVLTVIPTLIYGLAGVVAFLANGSLALHQFFVVSNCSLIAVYYLRTFPGHTTWFVLWTVLFWDLFAVLAPMGPLKKVQEKASNYSNNILKFLMFAADEKREAAGGDEQLNEERTIRRDVKQLIQLYSKREAQDDEFLQKIRQRRKAVNPDSGLTDKSPIVESEPSPVEAKEIKEKDSDLEESDDDEASSDSSTSTSSSEYSSASESGVSTANECDEEEWKELKRTVEPQMEEKTLTAADALNDGETVRLGFGDFVFYSLLIGQAAAGGCPIAVFSAAIGILLGLLATLTMLSTSESTTPALPVPVICGTFNYMQYDCDVSVIIPAKNAGKFLQQTLNAILEQTVRTTAKIEICLADDNSIDNTVSIMENARLEFEELGMKVILSHVTQPGGVGAAKDCAVRSSTGRFLCFNDADDVSAPERIEKQLQLVRSLSKSDDDLIFVGGQFNRLPEGSTVRYTKWANSITGDEIRRQVYTSHGPTLVAPTWFISRALFDKVGGFRTDVANGFPEDLDFFYKCLDISKCVFDKVQTDVVMYRYHQNCASHSVNEQTIWEFRLERLKKDYLSKWDNFTIWSAGKQGKRFFKSLTEEEKSKVSEFCDIDDAKIGRGIHEEFDEKSRRVTHKVPIVNIEDAKPPLVVCVKLDLTNGDLERIIERKGWREHVDLMVFQPIHEEEQVFVDYAIELVKKAGTVVRTAFESAESKVDTKSSNTDLVTETDQAVEKLLIAGLSEKFTGHRFIGEESVAGGAKIEWTDAPTWIIDPIDGTTNFVHRIPMIAICVGLAIKKQLRAGIVYNPITRELYLGQVGKGAFKNGFPIRASKNQLLSKAVLCQSLGLHNRVQFGDRWLDIAQSNMRNQVMAGVRGHRSFGSAAINMVMVAQGSCDGYVEYGIHAWDVAAPAVIVTEAGGVVTDPTGAPFDVMSRKVLCAGTAELGRDLSACLTHVDFEPEA